MPVGNSKFQFSSKILYSRVSVGKWLARSIVVSKVKGSNPVVVVVKKIFISQFI